MTPRQGRETLGEEANDWAGSSVRGLPDIDFDDHDELAVMARGAGFVYLVKGPVTGEVDLADAHAGVLIRQTAPTGEYTDPPSSLGDVRDLASGDFDGDGAGDLLLGNQSSVFVLHGPMTGEVGIDEVDVSFTEGSNVISLSGAGDMDADGYEDIVVGDGSLDSGTGGARVVFGPLSSSSLEDHVTLTGELASSYTGSGEEHGVTAAGDLNADGYADILVPSQGEADRGVVYVVYGPATSGSLSDAGGRIDGSEGDDTSETGYGDAAYYPAGPGDLDGDGKGDVVVGAPYTKWVDDGWGAKAPLGAAYLFLGPVTGTHALSSSYGELVGEEWGSDTGALLAGAGDVDGDGHADLLSGSVSQTELTGIVHLVYGGGAL